MEVNSQEVGEGSLPVSAPPPDTAALDIIRTETVLSRLPVHNLAKKGSISIQILKKTTEGEIELLWRVSPSRDYGEPRQLAYKLDTIIINQRIDEAGRPLPKMVRLGSLNDICTELGIAKQGGKSKNEVKRAFFQNVGALINAKFNYRANDGTERRLEAAFTRYNVIFTGEKLPDGRKADAVYIIFNEPFWEVLNSAPVRPLDRAYMKELPPAAQRFYEIVSRKIFAALKNHYPHAKISYSEYCTFSAQVRHLERQPAQDQMAKMIRPHKESGYITAVKYEATIDVENRPDWFLYLTPGPKAHAEFAIAHGRKPPKTLAASTSGMQDRNPKHRRVEQRDESSPATPAFDPQLIGEFTRRGVTEKKTIELLSNLKSGQDALAQLELGDRLIETSRVPVVNPPGFYVRLIETNTSVPENFETTVKRKAREGRERLERERRAAEEAREILESEYDTYCQTQSDRYIEKNPATFKELKDAKWKENRERYTFPDDMITTIAIQEAKREMRKQLSLPTFEEFLEQKKQGIDFSLKPVAVSPCAESASATAPRSIIGGEKDVEMTMDLPKSAEAIITPPEPAVESEAPNPPLILLDDSRKPKPENSTLGEGMI